MLLRKSRGLKAAPFEPIDFLQVGEPFREVGGPRPTLDYGNSSTGSDLKTYNLGLHDLFLCYYLYPTTSSIISLSSPSISLTTHVGLGGKLVESMPFDRRVGILGSRSSRHEGTLGKSFTYSCL